MNLFSQLRNVIHGQVITPEGTNYDEARAVFYGKFDRRPAVIVRPANAADVAYVIGLARESGMELAIRCGGHSSAGYGTTEGGILLDLSLMKGLDIDVEGRTAWAEGGLTAGEYTVAAGKYGLATGFGDTPSVGIGGLTVGGGIGYLVRKHGLAIDNLLAAEVVTADGQIRQVDANNHPDLFWAIRGGGGNFGVVTRFQFRLHEVRTIVGGMLILPATPDVIVAFIAAAEAAPEELSTIANIMVAPPMPFLPEEHQGKLIIMALMAYAGETSSGEQAFEPFRALEPLVDQVRPMSYPELYKYTEMDVGPAQEVARSLFVDRIDRDVAETIVNHLRASTAPAAVAQFRVLGGAMARVPAEATAFAHRDRRFMAAIGAVYEDAAETPKHEAWLKSYIAALPQSEGGVYVNFLAEEGEARIREAYPGTTWDRLAMIKAQYDPTNLFRLNQNIPPAVDGTHS
ncbi:MAG: FAD-binding oxidoreductase [Anaerolineae bacterium]|nr:FAD-binding oxidoreductase [Anaerolineae bacterium]